MSLTTFLRLACGACTLCSSSFFLLVGQVSAISIISDFPVYSQIQGESPGYQMQAVPAWHLPRGESTNFIMATQSTTIVTSSSSQQSASSVSEAVANGGSTGGGSRTGQNPPRLEDWQQSSSSSEQSSSSAQTSSTQSSVSVPRQPEDVFAEPVRPAAPVLPLPVDEGQIKLTEQVVGEQLPAEPVLGSGLLVKPKLPISWFEHPAYWQMQSSNSRSPFLESHSPNYSVILSEHQLLYNVALLAIGFITMALWLFLFIRRRRL